MKNILRICFLLLAVACSNPSGNKQKEHIEGSEEKPIKKRVYYKDFDLLTFQGKNKIESLDSLEKIPFFFSFSYLQDSLESIRIYSYETVIKELKYKKSDNIYFVYFEDNTYREMYGPNCVSYIYAKNDSIIKLYYSNNEESELGSLISIEVTCKGVVRSYDRGNYEAWLNQKPYQIAKNLTTYLSKLSLTDEVYITHIPNAIIRSKKKSLPDKTIYAIDTIKIQGISYNFAMFLVNFECTRCFF